MKMLKKRWFMGLVPISLALALILAGCDTGGGGGGGRGGGAVAPAHVVIAPTQAVGTGAGGATRPATEGITLMATWSPGVNVESYEIAWREYGGEKVDEGEWLTAYPADRSVMIGSVENPLVTGTQYVVYVRSHGAGLTSGWTASAPVAPVMGDRRGIPLNLTADASSPGLVQLAWQGTGGGIVELEVVHLNATNVIVVGNVPVYEIEFEYGGIVVFRARATHATHAASPWSVPVSVNVIGAGPRAAVPANVQAAIPVDNQITVTWTASAHAEWYEVERVAPGAVTQIERLGNVTQHIFTGMRAGREYTIRVRAGNAEHGATGWSTSVTATPTGIPPNTMNITVNLGDGAGVAPELSVFPGDLFVLPGQGAMTAPLGGRTRYFAGWSVAGMGIAGGGKHFWAGDELVAETGMEITAVWLYYLTLAERFAHSVAHTAGTPGVHSNPHGLLRVVLPPTGLGPFPLWIHINSGGANAGSQALGGATGDHAWVRTGLPIGVHTGTDGWPSDWERPDTADFQRSPMGRGYALASIAHRGNNTPDAAANQLNRAWPGPALDMLSGIRWLRENAATFQLDPDRFAISGHSFSAYMSLVAASLSHHPQGLAAIDVQPGNPNRLQTYNLNNLPLHMTAVQVAFPIVPMTELRVHSEHCNAWGNSVYFTGSWGFGCAICVVQGAPRRSHDNPGSAASNWFGSTAAGTPGAIGLQDQPAAFLNSSSPRYLAHPNMAPAILIHPRTDSTTKWQQSQVMYNQMRAHGVPVLFHNPVAGGHASAGQLTPANMNNVNWPWMEDHLNLQGNQSAAHWNLYN